MPRDLTLALGSASATPLQMARAYAVLANGGYLVEPYFIKQVLDIPGVKGVHIQAIEWESAIETIVFALSSASRVAAPPS